MEGDVAFDLLHDLVDVPVQHGHGSESLQIRQRSGAVVRAPAPLRIDRPQWDVREDDDGRAALEPLQILFEPLELLVPERAQAARLEIDDVDEADEVDAVVV